MAYIKKLPSGKYQVQIRLKGLRPISKSFKKKKDATDFARKVEGDIELARALGDPVTNKSTLADLIDDYLEQYDKKDQNAYTRLKWWHDQYGDRILTQFSSCDVQEGISILLKKGTRGRPLKPQTTNRFKANLSVVFTHAQNSGKRIQNPCKNVKGKPEGKGRQRVFTEDEKLRFLKASKQSDWDRFYLFVLMGFTSGARRGELLKLKWKDIDFNTAQAFCGDTKNGESKILHLTPIVIEELIKIRDAIKKSKVTELKKVRELQNTLVFIGQNGSTNHTYRKNWIKALKQAGIKELDDRYNERLIFHSERHTFCTDLHKAGKDLKVIQSLAGHKNINTTLRYTHDDEDIKASAVADVFGDLGISS
ncbi:MAG: site-specific integrase [gamma proteobacterium symbiont of Taylorina sp.]|nr:site-specific integrase [gamma proteobacterium symbiont of Taylorina sp.]